MLIKLIKPYTRIHIPFISQVSCWLFISKHHELLMKHLFLLQELNIDASEVECLLVSCILDKWALIFVRAIDVHNWVINYCSSTIHGRIDQVNQLLELEAESTGTARYNAVHKWSNQIASLHEAIVNRMGWPPLVLFRFAELNPSCLSNT